jgi:THO complex subunit 1
MCGGSSVLVALSLLLIRLSVIITMATRAAENGEDSMDVEKTSTDPLDQGFLSTLTEPLQSIVNNLLKRQEDASEATEEDAATLVDQFEIQLRNETLQRINPCLGRECVNALEELGSFWSKTLQICLHLVHFAARSNDKKEEDPDEQTTNPCYKIHVRKQFPVILLEDIVDCLPIEVCLQFWEEHVVTSYDWLFGVDLWSPVSPAKSHACWLPFLKVSNKLLRRNMPPQQAARLMQTVARIYPLAEKSANKVWGSHNVDNVTEWESAHFFESQQTDLVSNAATKPAAMNATSQDEEGAVADYSFYESFWKLQQDFHNPHAVSVADFLRRLRVVFAALESNKPSITSDPLSPRHARKYLTSSRLLTLQLQDTDFRIHILTQFLFVAHHLTSQVASLGLRLQDFDTRAKKLLNTMQPHGPVHLKLVESILSTLEPHWRKWKQNKCQPDLGVPKGKVGAKRKRYAPQDKEDDEDDDDELYQPITVRKDLPALSSRLRSVVPTVEEHLADYVEALDPESGIEPEYHPKNDKLFAWRALRLLSVDHLGQFDKVGPNGDFEPAIRHIYKRDKNVDIPGQAPVYNDDDESEEEKEEEEAGKNTQQDEGGEDSGDADAEGKDVEAGDAESKNGDDHMDADESSIKEESVSSFKKNGENAPMDVDVDSKVEDTPKDESKEKGKRKVEAKVDESKVMDEERRKNKDEAEVEKETPSEQSKDNTKDTKYRKEEQPPVNASPVHGPAPQGRSQSPQGRSSASPPRSPSRNRRGEERGGRGGSNDRRDHEGESRGDGRPRDRRDNDSKSRRGSQGRGGGRGGDHDNDGRRGDGPSRGPRRDNESDARNVPRAGRGGHNDNDRRGDGPARGPRDPEHDARRPDGARGGDHEVADGRRDGPRRGGGGRGGEHENISKPDGARGGDHEVADGRRDGPRRGGGGRGGEHENTSKPDGARGGEHEVVDSRRDGPRRGGGGGGGGRGGEHENTSNGRREEPRGPRGEEPDGGGRDGPRVPSRGGTDRRVGENEGWQGGRRGNSQENRREGWRGGDRRGRRRS